MVIQLGGTCFGTSQFRGHRKWRTCKSTSLRTMTIYFVAGEASGDNHGAALMQSLRRLRPDLRLLGRGGPKMKAVAGEPFVDWSDDAGVVGLWEV